MSLRALARMLLPPIAAEPARRLFRALLPPADRLTFAPLGWRTPLPAALSMDSPEFIAQEIAAWQRSASQPLGSAPFLFQGSEWRGSEAQKIAEHNQWVSYAYVLAMAARHRQALKVLDYGGHFGYFYRIARAALPGVAFDYHCKELPGMAVEGRRLYPEVAWHTDDSCLDARYDLVIMSAVLQYIPEWRALVRRASRSACDSLFITFVSTVRGVPGYVAVQRIRGAVAHSQVLNRDELLATVAAEGLAVFREFVDYEHPRIEHAPEQPVFSGWLFRRDP